MSGERLPIEEIRGEFCGAMRRHNRVVVTAPTGSGKSTRIPGWILDEGLAGGGKVVVLQPRRLAARMLASRVARERGVALGGEVGYRVRLESRAGKETMIEYETEGVLLRRMAAEPGLPGVGAVVLDEFHERHVYGDVTLSEALRLQARERPDLRVVAMSATLDTGLLRRVMGECAVVRGEGRTWPVEVEYWARNAAAGAGMRERPWEAAAAAYAAAARRGEAEGGTLIFMPGAYEIARTIEELRHSGAASGAEIFALHGELPPEEQDAAAAGGEDGRRRIVVATNVAETSLTIRGIRLVIDSGLARVARFDPWRGINTLLVENISRASADQRAGRAGRTGPGKAIRLWAESEQEGRAAFELPEIRRVDPSEVLLTLASMGVEDARGYPWVEAPEAKALERAERLLRDLGATDGEKRITALGRRMAAVPAHPRHARMLLAAGEAGGGAVRATTLVAALAQGRPLLLRHVDRATEERRQGVLGDAGESDVLLGVRAFEYARSVKHSLDLCRRAGIHAAAARGAEALWRRFLESAERMGLPTGGPDADDETVAKCLLTAFSDQVGRRLDRGTRRCDLVHGRRGELARESVAGKSPLLVASEINEIGRSDGEVQVLLTQATGIREEWLRELYPGDFGERVACEWDGAAKRVTARAETTFRGMALGGKPTEAPAEEAAALLAAAVLRGECPLKEWDRAVEQWMARTNLTAEAHPEWGLPKYDEEAKRLVVEQICHGHGNYKDVKNAPVLEAVKSLLSAGQRQLVEKSAPERVALENGRSAKVQYSDGEPYIALRIQELFGVERLPALAGGRVALTARILAPSQRPVQITKDLAGFWREHYPRIKQELRRKYPKHEWR